jgi:DNA-binding NtrC family response regulator
MATVLILDEENDWRTLLKRLLERNGHQVVARGHPEEAREWGQSANFDLVIVNIRHQQNGLPVPPHILPCRDKGRAIMVIADYLTDNDAQHFLADDYLLKPVDIETIECSVRELLEKIER